MTTATTESAKRKKKGGGRLTDNTDPGLDNLVRDKLITARVGLLLKAPFFGNLATRLTLVNADSWLETAATDGRKFYYNTEFVNKLKPKEVEFLFGHEVLHNVYDHLGRTGDFRDRMLFNCAADYCVNADLIDQGIGTKITPCLFDKKYRGWSAEEVYDDLYKNADKIDVGAMLDALLDEHLDNEGDGDGDGNSDGDSEGKGRPKLSKEERDQIKEEIRNALLQSAQATGGAGNLPGGVKRLLKDLTDPVVNWRDLLPQQIQSTIKDDFTFMRQNRKGWHMDAILPGMKHGNMIDVCVGIDMSGSIGPADSKAFLSEIKGIMDSYDEYKIQVWCFDTEVYNHQVFTSDNMSDILDYEPMGGGGTDFEVNWTFMKNNDIEPKKFIMFTDGMPFGSWGDPDYCDTVWIIKGNEDAKPPFGVWAIYEKEENDSK